MIVVTSPSDRTFLVLGLPALILRLAPSGHFLLVASRFRAFDYRAEGLITFAAYAHCARPDYDRWWSGFIQEPFRAVRSTFFALC